MSDSLGAPVPEPELSPEERAAFARGLAQFNDRLFFECHDTLEEIWSGVRGAPRDFFQGLIQAAVGFYHLGNGNRKGATTVLRRSLERLRRFPPRYAGVELARFVTALEPWLGSLETGAPTPPEPPRILTVAVCAQWELERPRRGSPSMSAALVGPGSMGQRREGPRRRGRRP